MSGSHKTDNAAMPHRLFRREKEEAEEAAILPPKQHCRRLKDCE